MLGAALAFYVQQKHNSHLPPPMKLYELYSKKPSEIDSKLSAVPDSIDVLKKISSKVLLDEWSRSTKKLGEVTQNISKVITHYNNGVGNHNNEIDNNVKMKILHVFLRCITLFISSGLKNESLDHDGVMEHFKKIENDIAKDVAARRLQSCYRKRLDKRINENPALSQFSDFKTKKREWRIGKIKERWKKTQAKARLTDDQVFEYAKQIREVYRDNGYFVFTQSTSTAVSTIFDLNKVLIHNFHPDEKRPPHYKAFRIPGKVQPFSANVKEFAQRHNIDSREFRDYNIPVENMSVDAYFDNVTHVESARHYYFANACVMAKHYDIISKILMDYIKGEYFSVYLERFRAIGDQMHAESTAGRFYIIAIPEDIVKDPENNFVYRSHACGPRCDCKYKESDIEILRKMQEGQPYLIPNGHWIQNEQYRLITSKMAIEKRVESKGFSTIPSETKRLYRHLIRRLGVELSICKLLEDIKIAPDRQLLTKLAKNVLLLSNIYQKPSSLPFAKDWKPVVLPAAIETLMKHSNLLPNETYANLQDSFGYVFFII